MDHNEGLATQATELPMPDCDPAGPHSLVLNGAEAPILFRRGQQDTQGFMWCPGDHAIPPQQKD